MNMKKICPALPYILLGSVLSMRSMDVHHAMKNLLSIALSPS